MAKGSSLYDNARSEKEPKGEAKKDERKGEEREVKKDDAKEPEEKSAAGGESEGGEGGGEAAAPAPHEIMLEGLKQMQSHHEAERRDHHANDREARRQMDARHRKAMKDHMDMHMAQMGSAPSAEGGGGAPAPVDGAAGEEE